MPLTKRKKTEQRMLPYKKVKRYGPSKAALRRTQVAQVSLGVEYKTLDTSVTDSALTATGVMTGMEHDPTSQSCLNSMAQGTTSITRIGRSVTNKTLQVRGVIDMDYDDATDEEKPCCFVALVRDKRSNGNQLNSEDVYVNPGGSSKTVCCATRNHQHRGRFDVLRYEQLNFSEKIGDISGKRALLYFDFFVTLNEVTNFNAGTGTIDAVEDISYHIVAGTTDAQPGTAGTCLLSYNAKLTYIG